MQPALALLAAAGDSARGGGCDRWEFAVEIRALHAAGLSVADLRSLVWAGYLEHARERTRPGDMRRVFEACANLAFFRRSCFVLTPAGESLVRGLPGCERRRCNAAPDSDRTRERPHAGAVPLWDGVAHTLFWRGRPVKHFRCEAPNQEAVLASFEASGWPRCVAVALPPADGVNAKRQLHDTVKHLNRNVRPALRFGQEGSGSRVRWQAAAALPQCFPNASP
jgi:hypothetical protein